MAKVIYDGNGADGGQVPVDSNTYTSGATVNDNGTGGLNDPTQAPHELNDSNGNPLNIVSGNLTKTGATFLYWNTKADGSGTPHGWPADVSFTFPNQTTNLTLYAQWAITTGLTNGGVTTHYAFSYDSSLAASGLEPARTEALLQAAENDYGLMAQTWFVGVTAVGPTPLPVWTTRLGGGANNTRTVIRLKPGTNSDPGLLRCLLLAEVTESFMHGQNTGWGFADGANNEQSCGEALSIFLTQQFALKENIAGPFTSFTGTGNNWLNSSLPTSNPNSTRYYDKTPSSQGYDYGSRLNYVDSTLNWPGNGPGTGCSILFLYYLYHQLGFSIPDIIAKAPGLDSSGHPNTGSCLRGVYQNLTGDTSDPFPFFAQLLANAFPPEQVASVPGPNPDDPWPLGSLGFASAKNDWGKDEVNDIISKGGIYRPAFYLMLEGFNLQVLGSARPSNPAIAFGGASTVPDTLGSGILYQTADPRIPQRIGFPFDVKFTSAGLGTFPPAGETPAQVTTSIEILGKNFPATTEFFFLAGADPYFTNVVQDQSNPANVNAPWLSNDLRVFTATPGAPPASQYQYPVPGGPQFVEHSVGGNFDILGAYSYLKALLLYLNQVYGDPTKTDPFDPAQNVIPGQSGAYTGDSSVTPATTVNGQKYNNYSFAIARVRLQATSGSPGATATGVRVFFRLWQTQTADTDWQPNYTYLSNKDSNGNPLWPEAPTDDHTIPFFATSVAPDFASAGDPEFSTGGPTNTGYNNQTITIKQGDSQWAYYGCFLNVNDPFFVVNGQVVPESLPGTHHCLVAEIAYAGAPIHNVGSNTETPENSGQLAQRNLQVTTSDNPGPPSTHRVPQTFDVRPSPIAFNGTRATFPDELMIDWGDTPVGSVASIYWPQVISGDVLALAASLYGTHPLSAPDSHTIQCTTVKGATYVPIPYATGDSFAALLTLDLPQTVLTGQEFNIIVRRIGTRKLAQPTPTPPPPATPQISTTAQSIVTTTQTSPSTAQADRHPAQTERYIVGSFQVKVPVSTREAMLPAEETTLAIFKARIAAMSPANRWYLVLLRYIELISARVNGLGGDANSIPASLKGYPGGLAISDDRGLEFTGKVTEVIFDCFGDFVGFVLCTCSSERRFHTRALGIREVVLRACQEQLVLSVFVERGREHNIRELVIRC